LEYLLEPMRFIVIFCAREAMMRRLSFPTIAIALLSSLEAGCIGGGAVYMTECKARLPLCDYMYTKEDWGPTGSAQTKGSIMLNTLPPKEYFLAEWGEPSETITVSEGEVTFVYKTVEWCGVGAAYVFPVPLMAPTCEGFDRITFKGSKATHIHFKRRNETFVLFGPGVAAEKGKSCPIPCYIDIRE
jgi:hypothetical protein